MLATSLAVAPATLPAQGAAIVDLDGPLLLENACQAGLRSASNPVDAPDRERRGSKAASGHSL